MGELLRARWAIVLTGLVALSCSHGPATTKDAGPQPVPPDIQQVCTDFVTTAFSVDTSTDHTPADARQRAARAFGAPDLASGLGGEGRDPDWSLLQAHNAHVAVTTRAVADDPPPVRADQSAAGVHVTRTAVGLDGWRQTLPAAVAYCALRRGATGWRVTGLTVSDDGAVT